MRRESPPSAGRLLSSLSDYDVRIAQENRAQCAPKYPEEIARQEVASGGQGEEAALRIVSHEVREVLVVSETLDLAMDLRRLLRTQEYDLTWCNNFWTALSFVHTQRFCGLVMDLGISSMDDRYFGSFLEEYGLASWGPKVLLFPKTTGKCKEMPSGHPEAICLGRSDSPSSIFHALGLHAPSAHACA